MSFKYLWLFDGFLSVVYDIISQQDKPIQFNLDEYQVISFNDLPDYEQTKYHTKTCNQFDFTKAGFIKIMGYRHLRKRYKWRRKRRYQRSPYNLQLAK